MAGKVKTRDRILKTSLALFNEEGEAQISTVDIAAVMEISPGNLYYHFKGKEAIITGLFDGFEEEIAQVLNAPINQPLCVEDHWIYLYIVFEEINDFRFFYNNLTGMLERCPDLATRFARIMRLKEKSAAASLGALEAAGAISCAGAERDALARRIAAHVTFWLQYERLSARTGDAKSMINRGVYAATMMVAPYASGDRAAFAATIDEYFATQR